MRLLRLFVLLSLLPVHTVSAQVVVRGRVSDGLSGEPLPSAHVVVEGTYLGTITNLDGEFELHLDGLPRALAFRYVGYESLRLTITAPVDEALEIRLRPVSYRMPEIVVSDENPAVGIMRCVIERKQEWRAALVSYSADAYTRFTISNDTGIVSIVESLSEVFWERGRGSREIVKSQRQTSNINLATYLPAAQFITNLYDDDVELAGYDFVGVTHPRALQTYRFELQGTRMMDDQLVYDIAVEPRNRLKTAFRGRISVLADACALLDVSLEPGDAFLFPPPIKRLDVTYHQQYHNFGGNAWLPADFRADVVAEVSLGFLMTFPPFRIRQTSRLTDYAVNAEVPDSLFDVEEGVPSVDKEAVAADTLLAEEGAGVPLDSLERMAYRTIDSTMTLDRAFAPSGALARAARVSERREGDGRSNGSSLLNRLNVEPRIRFNRVEAFHGGISTTQESGRLRVRAGAGWSSALDDAWSYDADAAVFIGPHRRYHVAAAYAVGVESTYESAAYGTALTSLYSLIGGGDYFDYVRNERWSLRAGYDHDRLAVGIDLSQESPSSVAQATDYTLFGRLDEPRANPPVTPETVRSARAAIRFGDDETTLGFTGRRFARIDLELGKAGAPYTRIAVDAEWRLETFFRRRILPNALDVRLTAGSGWGDLPLHRVGIVDGSLGIYRPFGVLRTRTGRPYVADRYVGLMWEHSFRTVPFEVLGLRGLARRGYGMLLTGAHARTSLASSRLDPPGLYDETDGFHHEIGVAFSGLLGVLRVDVSARLDEPGVTVGLAAARLF